MKGEKDDHDVDCREALHRVYHFLDGELTPERRDQIARHLDGAPRASGVRLRDRDPQARRRPVPGPGSRRAAHTYRRCDRPRAQGKRLMTGGTAEGAEL